ncbi:MAG: hypothetical protein L3K14_03430 [Thermoplasmata archaeon]|nr:hypothetical protein [Thermoplasmata archaeon]
MMARWHWPALVVTVTLLTILNASPAGLALRPGSPAGTGAAPTPPPIPLPLGEALGDGPSPVPVGPHVVPPSAPPPIRALTPAPAPNCPTPQNLPAWSGPSFFHDVEVHPAVPSHPELSGASFQVVPCTTVLPTYSNGFWFNLSTNVRLSQVAVQVWATGWPTPANPQPWLPGFRPDHPALFPMVITGSQGTSASFFFNVYHYFPPGTNVSFNLTAISNDPSASPSSIYSAQGIYSEPETYAGGIVLNATWMFTVATPWRSTNFSEDIAVSTSPPVLQSPAFEPNRYQALQVSIQSFNLTGGPTTPIPAAILNATLMGASGGFAQYTFGPQNHSMMNLTVPIGPYPSTDVSFYITAYLPWLGGSVDPITSPTFSFSWSANGGWWYPSRGVEANLQVGVSPTFAPPGTATRLPTGEPVTVTLHSPTPNVTIGSAQLAFLYTDSVGSLKGSVPMSALSANTSLIRIPGLPAGATLTFYLVAKDIYQDPITSGNMSYSESGPPKLAPPAGEGLFVFEALDLSTGHLVPFLNFTLANDTWSTTGVGYAFGFAEPLIGPRTDALPVAFGSYSVTSTAFGATGHAAVTLHSVGPVVVVFYVASGAVPVRTGAGSPTAELAAIIGLAAGAVAAWPILRWFSERRAASKAEQRRITL